MVPTIAELRPGLIQVFADKNDDNARNYFCSGGYAMIHPDGRADIACVELCDMNEVDGAEVKRLLGEASAKWEEMKSADDSEPEKAKARIAFDVYDTLNWAIDRVKAA
jgi:F-type H+-transporting ATPase subunit delta